MKNESYQQQLVELQYVLRLYAYSFGPIRLQKRIPKVFDHVHVSNVDDAGYIGV